VFVLVMGYTSKITDGGPHVQASKERMMSQSDPSTMPDDAVLSPAGRR